MLETRPTKLNLGCGSRVVAGWTNVDYAPGARFARIPLFRRINKWARFFDADWSDEIVLHDLTTRFPWTDDSADVVYSSHTLEHLSREDGRRFLAECHRVLKHGGIVRLVVPDLRAIIDDYLAGRTRADELVEKLNVLYSTSKNPIKRRLYPFIQSQHKCMYDTPGLLAVMRGIGFDAASRAPFDSDIAEIGQIEVALRTVGAVIVEGRKR